MYLGLYFMFAFWKFMYLMMRNGAGLATFVVLLGSGDTGEINWCKHQLVGLQFMSGCPRQIQLSFVGFILFY